MTTQSVAGIILAAGSASRMGRPKQLLDWGGQPLIRAIATEALAAGLADLLVVVGNAQADVIAALAGLPVKSIANPAYASGQSTSLRTGIAALEPHIAAALILLGDQPFVSTAIIKRIIAEWRASQAPIVAPTYRGQRGNPVLFARTLFPELLAITGDQGARSILAARASETRIIPFDDDRPLADIDTPEDYQRLKIPRSHS